MLEINEVRMLFPAMVKYTQDGKELSVFVYVDQLRQDVIIPDSSDIPVEEFKAQFAKQFPYGRKYTIPETPKNLERERPK